MLTGAWLRAVIFALGSLAIAFASRRNLREPGSHGYFRLFAFVAVLGLVVLALDRWFARPFSALQLVSWVLLALSILFVLSGFALLIGFGRPRGSFEDTTNLVTVGVYRFIRHPLYSSLLFLAWGAFLKAPSWAGAAVLAVACVFLWYTALAEEGENLAKFGEDYAGYMARSKRFIPFIF